MANYWIVALFSIALFDGVVTIFSALTRKQRGPETSESKFWRFTLPVVFSILGGYFTPETRNTVGMVFRDAVMVLLLLNLAFLVWSLMEFVDAEFKKNELKPLDYARAFLMWISITLLNVALLGGWVRIVAPLFA